uniref:Lipocalin/cytosolic fatty-acid binding domain-containing protein n=1 Tax=Peromyscus maniculatus bairdii TaxID=230844 RepID=A0A8C8UN31_PERMB
MKALLLSFGLSLVVALCLLQVSGTWYVKATASDKEIPDKKLGSVSVTPMTIKTLEEGNLEVKFTVLYNGECLQIDILLEKTEKPGQYSAFWDTNLMYIYELPVMDHYIFYSECQIFEQKVYAGELIGRTLENHEALEEFKKFVQQKGFPPENIIVPEQRGKQVTLEITS